MGVVKYYEAPLMVAPNGKLIPDKGKVLPLLTEANRVRMPHDFHKAIYSRLRHL